MEQVRSTFWQRHRVLKWLLIGGASAFAVFVAVLVIAARHAEPFLRDRIIAGLSARFQAPVDLDSFSIRPGNSLRGEWGLWAEGKGLRIWPQVQGKGNATDDAARKNGEPLIRLNSFRFHVPLRLKASWPIHIGAVRLAGLSIHIPPRDKRLVDSHAGKGATLSGSQSIFGRVRIDGIQCIGADLLIESGKPGKVPLDFAIDRLTLGAIASNGTMHFQADLSNPRPPGYIHTAGTFGPWVVSDPGESTVSGAFSFEHADLSVFPGIAGILSSTGSYQGVLRELVVDGVTETPDFRLERSGKSVALHTHYHAFVDGTNGDTDLEPVEATLGRSSFTARGKIVGVRAEDSPSHVAGHEIKLVVSGSNTHVDDFLRLAASNSDPALTGSLSFHSSLHIAPGSDAVQKRLELEGTFTLDQVEFSSDAIQKKIRELSLRAQGKPGQAKAPSEGDVKSSMAGDFTMKNGVITLPNLNYAVPGADVTLHGTYTVDGGAIDFDGKARMQATVSKMVGGWKGFFLKAADPFFKKDGAGAEFPVHIGGTRDKPSFGLNFNHSLSTSPQSPADSPAESPAPAAAQPGPTHPESPNHP